MKHAKKIIVSSILASAAFSSTVNSATVIAIIHGSQWAQMQAHFRANESLLAGIASTNTINHQATTTAITAAINASSAQDRATASQTTSTIQKTQEQNQEYEELKRNQKITEDTIEKYGEPPSVCSTAEAGKSTRDANNSSRGSGAGGSVSGQAKVPTGSSHRAPRLIKDELENGSMMTNAGPEAETLKDSSIYLSNYCTDEERSLASTKDMCNANNPAQSKYPNGSVAYSAFQNGPGFTRHVEKSPGSAPHIHRTLEPNEMVAVNLFTKGLADDESFTKALTKEQTKTAAGVLYFSKLKAFEREKSVALAPFQRSIEDRAPASGTKDLVKAMKDSAASGAAAFENGEQTMWGTSAYEYYQEIKKSKDRYYSQVLGQRPPDVHEMSARELLAFDIERRYSNEYWYQEIASMPSESPIDKEQTFMMAQSNFLMFKILEQLEMSSQIQGLTLMNLARQYHAPTLSTLYEQVAKEALSTVGGSNTSRSR